MEIKMALDAVCIKGICAELSEKLLNGRIDKIHQPEKDEIVIHVRTFTDNYRLVISAGSAHPRIHLTNTQKKNPITAPMFCMLLRKHLGSGKIIAIEQVGFERIIKISVESYDELGDLTVKHIIAEIMGRNSNIILVNDDMKIIDSIKRVDFTVSTVRQVLPGLEYVLPPTQERTPLTDVDSDTTIDFTKPQPAEKALMSSVSGISPLTAREVIYRALGRTDVNTAELNLNKQSSVKAELIRLAENVKNGKFTPCVIKEKSSGRLIDFSAVEIRQYEGLAEVTETETLSTALDDFYSIRDMHERMRQRSADMVKLLNNAAERTEKKITILVKTLKDAENKDTYKIMGELITSNLYRIKDGDRELTAENYYDNMNEIKIPLLPELSASQNAQRYFKRYNKAKTAETEAAKQLKNAREELDYIESTLAAVENAETETDLREIRAELIKEGYLKRRQDNKRRKNKPSEPLHFVSSDGFDIYVGKNNTQNDYVTTKLANSSDLWFHTKNIHGSHTIIKLGINKDVPRTTVIEAAQLAAYYSKARESSQVPVDYTKIKNVKKPNGAKPGMVIYEGYNTIYVTPHKINE
ncbi:MAG: NFACT RNA binding domain-containing protein [Clostridia bacterium]|nr:NFACT RNA binding domain-containing protein [Clostridia bacterium]